MATSKTPIHIKQLTFCQRLLDRARDGYLYYTQGICQANRFPALREKFRRLYDINLSKDRRFRVRRDGGAVYSLLAYQPMSDTGADVHWVLMKTNGRPALAADPREVWHDMTVNRLVVLERFELCRHTRTDMSHPSWSWRLQKQYYEGIRAQLISHVRRRSDEELKKIIHSLHTAPKFALIRDQLYLIHKLIEAEWKRSRSTGETMPTLPRIGYARRVADQVREAPKMRWKRSIEFDPKEAA